MVTPETLQRAVTAARELEAQGYFEKVRAGDQKAASLFARLTAYTLNPVGSGNDYGCLSKTPGETNVDGFAEDAICFTSNPADLENVVDLVNGAGAPGASIGGAVKPRRTNNLWVKPVKLSDADMLYLRMGIPEPPVPQPPAHKPYPGDPVWDAVGATLFADYARGGQAPNPQMGRWFGRTIWDATAGDETGKVYTVDDSIKKHRPEWCGALGIPVQP